MYKIPLRKTYEITGHHININHGSMYHIVCDCCYDEEYKEWIKTEYAKDHVDDFPIFLGDEWDDAPVCEECGEKIEVNIIE